MLAYSEDVCFHLSSWFSFLFLTDWECCTATVFIFVAQVLSLLSTEIAFLLFGSVAVICTVLSSNLSTIHLWLAAAARAPPPPPLCFFFSWQLYQGPHIKEAGHSCCTILVDGRTYISQLTVYFSSIVIYLPGSQSGGKQGRGLGS